MRKVAFIMGASSGFGEACVKAFISEDFRVTVLAGREEGLSKLKGLYKEQIYTLSLDVRKKKKLFEAVAALPSEFQNISVLFNNAGLALGLEEFDKLSLDDVDAMVDTNVKGFLYIVRAVIPLLRRQENAYIFNLGSIAENVAYFGGNVHCGTKAFVRQFSRALRSNLRGTNIKVINIAPGLCKTEFSEVRFRGDKAQANVVYEDTKFIMAEDIARVVMSIVHLPPHINANKIELMPVMQSWAGSFAKKVR